MTQARSAVAIFARISQDRDGTRLGVERQLTDCRREAERLGWTVAEEYVDDDISAYSGKHRPAFERMLSDIADRRAMRSSPGTSTVSTDVPLGWSSCASRARAPD